MIYQLIEIELIKFGGLIGTNHVLNDRLTGYNQVKIFYSSVQGIFIDIQNTLDTLDAGEVARISVPKQSQPSTFTAKSGGQQLQKKL